MNAFTAPISAQRPKQSDEASQSSRRSWIALLIVAMLALALVMLSVQLRAHADARRAVVEGLSDLELAASGQNTLVWLAMTQLMADETSSFNRTRGQEQIRRNRIYEALNQLREQETAGERWNARLGYPADPEALAALTYGVERFVSSVQGAFGLMHLSRERMRDRLRHWDMNYGQFKEALEAVRERDQAIAVSSTRAANIVTGAAALITLVLALLFVSSLARVRARRIQELTTERLNVIEGSESRFRGLVQHSTDLILVVERQGGVRYASPSAQALGGQLATLAGQAPRRRAGIEQLVGYTIEELLHNGRTEVTLKDSARQERIYEIRATDLSDHPEIDAVVLNGRDITDAKALENRLRHQALHDPLTGLPNRRSFTARFDEMTDDERNDYHLLFIDLDGFKLVNDSYGHSVGDQLLIHTAARIRTCLADGDLLVRQGGDEFLVLCEDATMPARIQQVMKPPFELGRGIGQSAAPGRCGTEVFISASIGVVSQLAKIDAEQAAQRADIAMYKAKEAGKAQAVDFAEEMLEGAPERLALESDFRRALERHEFSVVYQPKVGLRSGVTESLEALVRWIHPTRGFVGPDLFIPFAEESGLVNELGRQVLEKACQDAVRWQPFGVVVAVNLSPIQFRNPALVEEVKTALELSGLDPKYLELEITESAVLGDVKNTIEVMKALKSLGIRLAIDDFGTGYSNLAHLKHFDVDVLKIDQAFVRGENPGSVETLSDGAIVEAVIGMARAIDMHVVAEGVELSQHAAALKSLGADLGQGYYFSKPVDGTGIDDFLAGEVDQGRRQAPSLQD